LPPLREVYRSKPTHPHKRATLQVDCVYPVAHIDLHGLQKVLAITQIGTNSKGENFIIRSTEINKPSKGGYNHLYSSYANPNKYGDKGKLEVLHHVDKDISVEKYTQEKSFMGHLADLFDGEVNGGIQFSLSFGQGKEKRSSQSAEIGSSLDELISAFGVTSTATSMPISNNEDVARFIFSAFQNTIDVFSAMKQDKSNNKTTKEPADSVCNTCNRSPHGLPYRTIDSEGNPIDTINPSEEKRNQ